MAMPTPDGIHGRLSRGPASPLSRPSSLFRLRARIVALFIAFGMLWGEAIRAEAPMSTDDAGTLGKGGFKVEGIWSRDDKTRGGELSFGFAPAEHLEIGIAASRATDQGADPGTRLHATGISFKWVPIQNETGWSLGTSFSHDRTQVDDRSERGRFIEKEWAFSGLATFRFAGGQVVHANLGAARIKAHGISESAGTWGIGYEHPIMTGMQLTAEIFGAERTRPDKAIGIRHEIFDGFKISGAIGHGNGRGFGQAGFAWEF